MVGGATAMAGGTKTSGLTDPDRIWSEASLRLRAEIGDGFAAARAFGSENNDPLTPDGFAGNHAGGILGGISTGQEIVARIAVKPTPSINIPQRTIDTAGAEREVRIGGRHDPCIVPRIVPVAECMTALVVLDALLEREKHRDFTEKE